MIDMFTGEDKSFTLTITDGDGISVDPTTYDRIVIHLYYEKDFELIKTFDSNNTGDLTITTTDVSFNLLSEDTTNKKEGIIVAQFTFTDSVDGTNKSADRFINLNYAH